MRKNKETIADHGPGADLAVASNEKSRKTRAGFATLAVLGLGAGITLAAFTGNVLFQGDVAVAGEGVFQLQGQVTSDQAGDHVTEPWTSLEAAVGSFELTPEAEAVTRYLWVQEADGAALEGISAEITHLPDGVAVTGYNTWTDVSAAGDGTLWQAAIEASANTEAAGTASTPFTIDVTGSKADGTS